MSYNKRTWANGNVVGAVDLNRMEDGIASGDSIGLIIKLNGVEGTCNGNTYYEYGVSYNAVVDALEGGRPIYFRDAGGTSAGLRISASHSQDVYRVEVIYLFDLLGQTATFNVIHLYSDTADGNMRDYNCWGGASQQS